MATVLIADDASVIRIMLNSILTANGHTVVGEAITGTESVEKYKQLKPDLVTMDITMPELDGVAATKAIMDFDPEAKIIIVSAMGQKNMIVHAIQAGAKYYLIKPFTQEKVIETINAVLKQS
ncbi:MAG: response regulator [Bacillota bacterium]